MNAIDAVAEKVLEYNMSRVSCPIYQNLDNFWIKDQMPVVPHMVNLVTNWSGTDNEENFIKNPKPGYTADSIIYKYNSHGFRTKEIDFTNKKPSIICLGCGLTEGVGVNYEQTWVSEIEKNFPEYNTYNFGVNGSSGDTATRILYLISNILNIHTVFILWPHITRYEIYNTGGVVNMWPNNKIQGYTPDTLTDTNFFNLREKNRAFVSTLSTLHKFRVIEEFVDAVIHAGRPSGLADYGRDNHPGPIWHKNIAKHFMEKYDNSTI